MDRRKKIALGIIGFIVFAAIVYIAVTYKSEEEVQV
jgi:hypothetical protein